MHARITRTYGYPERIDEVLERMDGVADQVAQVPGLQYWFVTSDHESGEGLVVTIYDTKESADAAADTAQALREGFSEFFLKPPEVFEHEVDAYLANV